MKPDQVWAAVDAQRRAVADLLSGLREDEWQQRSLCPEWTVREVVGHLTLQRLSVRELAVTAVHLARQRGDVDRVIADAARRTAIRPVGALIADVRRTVGWHKPLPSTSPTDTLIDILVHGQDIVRPLGRRLASDAPAAAAAADRAWHRGAPWFAARRLAGVRLTADDADLQLGAGSRVSGAGLSLLLVITGRHDAVDDLSGPGLPRLRALLDPT